VSSGSRATVAHKRPAALLLIVASLACCGLATAAGAGASSAPTLPGIERQVMCVTCKIPLNVAESQQADRERAFIQSLIDEGRSEAQIKHALVDQYGPTVLGLPAAHGFNLLVYLVPLAVVLALLVLLALLLPRWRRGGRPPRGETDGTPPLDAHDAERLDADLSRFG
jgi:cytochrome c-type biogenesis protein CcmH